MHGSGYRVVVRVKDGANVTEDDADPLLVALKEEYDASDEQIEVTASKSVVEYIATSSTKTTRVFSITTPNLSLGGLFQLLEDKKEEIGIIDYSVSQTTMEQVFTKFAQFQVEE